MQLSTPIEKVEVINYSGLKCFSTCPLLWKERYLDGTNKQEPKDYFLYGSLVDCMITDPTNVDNRFFIGKKKREADPIKLLEKKNGLLNEIEDLSEKAQSGNKTAIKSIASRQEKIAEIDEVLNEKDEDEGDTRQRVTPSMWEDAQETADEIASLPLFQRMQKAEHEFQVELISTRLKRRGTLDILAGSEPVMKLYRMAFKEKIITYEEFRKQVDALPEQDRWLAVFDVKTIAALKDKRQSDIVDLYGGQLSYYKSLVTDIFGIVPSTGIFAGDKQNGLKMSQEYLFSDASLAFSEAKTVLVEEAFWRCHNTGHWPSSKETHGFEQTCFTCSKCRKRPHSRTEEPCQV